MPSNKLNQKNNLTIAIVGGGQLGRMLTTPAKEMGFEVVVLDPTENCPANQVGARQILGKLTDPKAIRELAKESDIITFEIEHIDADTLEDLEKQGKTVYPSPITLKVIKDKLSQKKFLKKNDISTAAFAEIKNYSSSEARDRLVSGEARSSRDARTIKEQIIASAGRLGYPLLLKSRFGGYDGRGNFLLKKEKDIPAALEKLGKTNLYVEQFVPFKKELSVIAARATDGTILTYPVVETVHKNNILHYLIAPAPISKQLQTKAEKLAKDVMQHLGGAGVFGIEMFLTKKGEILINEIAPRVHNSGHHTIEACYTSQFENHIRAITGLPLGATSLKTKAAVMINILGERTGPAKVEGLDNLMKIPGTSIHLYGKVETRPERKMGHITVVGNSTKECLKMAKRAQKAIII